MDPEDPSAPMAVSTRELRVLVLHNQDFERAQADETDAALSADTQARADVANVARSVARALAARGHFAEVQGIDRDDIPELLGRLRQDPPDLVFNLVESLLSDDRYQGAIPTLLALYGIAYTGSDGHCLNLTLRKHMASPLLRSAGIATPLSTLLPAQPRSRSEDLAAVQGIGYPLFLKLAEASGSIGISARSVVHSDEELLRQLDFLRQTHRQPLLAERFVEGREIYVSMLGNAPLQLFPLQEIDFSQLPQEMPHIVTESAKWLSASFEYSAIRSIPIRSIHPTVRARVEEAARRAFTLLDVRDYGRCDVRLSENGTPHIIDVNSNCDLAEDAGYSLAAGLAGLTYDQLIEQIALTALQRTEHARQNAQRETSPRPHHSGGDDS